MESGIFSVIFIIAIFIWINRLRKKVKSGSLNMEVSKNVDHYKNYRPATRPTVKRVSNVYNTKSEKRQAVSAQLKDDRVNDWLAKQLRDEHVAFKGASEMFGLKIEHSSHCDAMLLKNFHSSRCDAKGVDTATKK